MAAASCAGCAAGTETRTMRTTDQRANRLFIFLAGFFLTNALIAEFVGVKIFALEDTVGAQPFHWSLFGIDGTLNFTAGVLLWPFVFIMTDVINEYFGVRGVRLISWIAVAFIAYAFIAAYAAISLAPAAFWVDVKPDSACPTSRSPTRSMFGQGLWTICGSIIAFLVGQLIDVAIFHRILRDDRRAIRVAARHGVDRGVAAARQLHRAVHRVRDRAAALVDPAVSRGGHRQLRLQDVRGGRADPAAVPRARRIVRTSDGEAERLRREAASD